MSMFSEVGPHGEDLSEPDGVEELTQRLQERDAELAGCRSAAKTLTRQRDDAEDDVKYEHTERRRAERKRDRLITERDKLRTALRELYAEVEMAESVGICLPNRAPALTARDLLADGD